MERSTIVDIELRFDATEVQREEIITAMFLAGYKLRGDELNTLTFQKDND